ncbi:MAG TPA: hypothetical protein VIG93_02110, partial [Gaiellaceae bacterium]
MRHVLVLAALVALGVAVVRAQAAERGFPYGVAAGEVTATSAILWTRTSAAGTVWLDLLPPGASTPIRTYTLRASRAG